MRSIHSYLLTFILICFVAGCTSTPGSEKNLFSAKPYTQHLPVNLQKPFHIPSHNPMTEEGVALGKKLFYDPLLSSNNQVSCATCHILALSFSDGKALSNFGVSGKTLQRHVPQLLNVAWHEGLFWDGGAKNLESMVFGPLSHPDEMGADLKKLVHTLIHHDEYPALFKKAFGSDAIQSAFVSRALAQYMRTIIGGNSRYDHFVRGESGEQLTVMERKGLLLTQEKCGSCHTFESGEADFFTDFSYHNNGLDSIFPEEDERVKMGRFRLTFDSTQIGAYKTPTLRNVVLTAPYMHDGRFRNLEEVLNHYSQNMVASPYLDSLLYIDEDKVGISMNEKEREAIIAFLHALSEPAIKSH